MPDARHAWRVSGGQALRRREWDGEAVLFNDLSGATHLLSSTAVWLLERLATAPADLASLAAALEVELAAQADGNEADADAVADVPAGTPIDHAHLADLLADLCSLDLIEPC